MGIFGSGDGGLSDAKRQLQRNRYMYDQIDLPDYEEMIPELYDNETANYSLTEEDPVIKSKQLEALARMSDLSSEGLSDTDRAGFAQARAMGDSMARSGTQSAIQDAQVRGVAGSGQEFAMREAANQAGAQRAQEAALQQQAAAAQQRQQYLQAYSQGLGNVRGQDQSANAANTNIINQFNRANTDTRNKTNMSNVGLRNSAFEYNQGLKDKNYQNQVGRADRIAGLNDREGEMSEAEKEAKRRRNQAAVGAIGAVAGGAIGGPAGAAAGSQAGNLVG